MNPNKEISNEERKKILEMINSLENTSEANIHKIISYKSKLETINDQLVVKKKLVNYCENKLEELMTEIANTEWYQIKAKTVLKSEIEYAEKFKYTTDGIEENINEFPEDDTMTNKIADLKQEKDNLERLCKTNYEIILKLFNELEKLKEECEINNVNQDI